LSEDINLYAIANVHEVSTEEQLNDVRNNLTNNYIMVNNITLTSLTLDDTEGWTPIGANADTSDRFSGIFNGDGFKITELYINSTSNYMGLFGYLTGSVKNLGVETAAGGVKGYSYTGAIAGHVAGTITGCYSTGSVSGASAVGGIAGGVDGGTITNNVAANSIITGNANRVVDYIDGANTIKDNYARTEIQGSFNSTSAGYGTSKTDSDLRTKATYLALEWDFASLWHMDEGYGFPRFIWQEVTISVSVDGVVTEQAVIGGAFTVPAALSDSRFLGWNTYFDGNGTALTPGDSIPVSAGFTIYAFMKGNRPDQPIEISTVAEFNAIRNKPNLHYKLISDISLSAYNTDPGWIPIGTTSTPFSGSLDGGGFKITELYINSTSLYMGLFGYLAGALKNLGVETEARGVKGGSYTGAIAGYVNGGMITNSYSTGSVSGYDYVGGIVGNISGGTITNSYSTGDVSGYDVGGIVGFIGGGTITNNVATNTIITGSGSNVSRVVGRIGNGTVSNNFANSGMTAGGSAFDTTAANYGVSKSLTALQTQTTYSDPINGNGLGGLGWQFCDGGSVPCDAAHPWVWGAFPGYSYPTLYWQTEAP
jgi:hypothetical protein